MMNSFDTNLEKRKGAFSRETTDAALKTPKEDHVYFYLTLQTTYGSCTKYLQTEFMTSMFYFYKVA